MGERVQLPKNDAKVVLTDQKTGGSCAIKLEGQEVKHNPSGVSTIINPYTKEGVLAGKMRGRPVEVGLTRDPKTGNMGMDTDNLDDFKKHVSIDCNGGIVTQDMLGQLSGFGKPIADSQTPPKRGWEYR